MAHFPVRRPRFVFQPRFLVLPALAVVAAALLAGCHPAVSDPNDPKFVVAEKGDIKVTKGDLDAEVNRFLASRHATPDMVGASKMPILQTAMLRNMILKELMLERANSIPLKDVDKAEADQLAQVKGAAATDADFEKQLQGSGMTIDDLKKKIHEKVLVTKLLEAEAFKDVEPTDAEINAIYAQYKDSFKTPATVRVSRILVHVDPKAAPADLAAKKKIIDAAHARVVKGEDFSKVAMDMSEDESSKPKGGDLGPVQQGESEPGFDEVAFKEKVNTVSPVFQTPLGYEFIKVTDSHPAGVVPIADARAYITGKLKEQKMEMQEQDYAKKLLANSGVVYHITLVDPPSNMMPPGAQGAAAAQAESQGGAPAPAPDAAAPQATAATPPMSAADATNAPTPEPAPTGTAGK
jgi:parvulin-like peptidyl-prolyl isomerase